MIKTLSELYKLEFNEDMEKFITSVEETYETLVIVSGHEPRMLECMNKNISNMESDKLLVGTSDREKFLLALGMMVATLTFQTF